MQEKYYAENKHGYMRYESDRFAKYIYSLIQTKDFTNFLNAIEFGAGMGRFSAPLMADFAQVTLVEPTPAYAAILKESFPDARVRIFQGTFQEFIENESVEKNTLVFCFHLLHHLSPKERGCLYEFIRNLQAKAVFVEPNPFNPLILIQVLIHPDMSMAEEYQYLLLTRRRYRQELSKHGLRLASYKRICTLPPFLMGFLLKRIPAKTLRRFEFLAQYIPFCGSYQIIICE
jgi:hypothetical protein